MADDPRGAARHREAGSGPASMRGVAAPFPDRLAPALFGLWAILLLWPVVLHPAWVLMPPRSEFSDLLISHWPNAEFLRRSLAEYRQVPLWNPSILGGAPFAADPLAGLWYPPLWLALVLPLPFAFNLLLAAHLAWGGWGMYRWARADGFASGPAIVGGLAFAGMPKLIAHAGAGHVSLLFAVAWTPWLLQMAPTRRPSLGEAEETVPLLARRAAIAALVGSLLFLADLRWAAYAGLALAWLWMIEGRGRPRRAAASLLLCIALVVLVTAALWLPLREFVDRSTRIALTPEEAGAFALPARYLIGVVLPDLGGFQEWMTYLGVAPLALAALGLFRGKDRASRLAMIALGAIAAWWALGPGGGLFAALIHMPGLTLLRVPSRAWFLVGLAVAWLAVRGASALAGPAPFRPRGRLWNLASAGIITAAWALAIGGSLVSQRPLVSAIGSAMILTGVLAALRIRPALLALSLIAAAELLWVNSTLIEARPVTRSALAAWLREQPGVWRVYSPSYSLPQLDAVLHGLQQADGVNPIQLADTVSFMGRATGVPAAGYSVTLPRFDGDVATANASAVPDAMLLGEFNVRYVASEFDLRVHGLAPRIQIGSTMVYENAHDGGRVRGGALTAWSPNRLEAEAEGPGTVVFSEVWYPGWTASVDGRPVEIERSGIFRAVGVGPGRHSVALEFRPASVYGGAAVSAVGLALAAYCALRFARPGPGAKLHAAIRRWEE